jgi:hypothetical protein
VSIRHLARLRRTPRKSPLRIATGDAPPLPAQQEGRLSPAQLQAMMISEFELWLRSRTSKEKRPFHKETILANVSAISLFGSGDDHVTALRRQ